MYALAGPIVLRIRVSYGGAVRGVKQFGELFYAEPHLDQLSAQNNTKNLQKLNVRTSSWSVYYL